MSEGSPFADRVEQKILFELEMAPMPRTAPRGVEAQRVTTREKLFAAVNDSFRAFESISRPSILRTVISLGVARVLHYQECKPVTREEFDARLSSLTERKLVTVNGEEVMLPG